MGNLKSFVSSFKTILFVISFHIVVFFPLLFLIISIFCIPKLTHYILSLFIFYWTITQYLGYEFRVRNSFRIHLLIPSAFAFMMRHVKFTVIIPQSLLLLSKSSSYHCSQCLPPNSSFRFLVSSPSTPTTITTTSDNINSLTEITSSSSSSSVCLSCYPNSLSSSSSSPSSSSSSSTSSSSPVQSTRYIIAMHPHGALSYFRPIFDSIIYEVLPFIPSTRAIAARSLFWIPVIRELALGTNCIDADRVVAEKHLSTGHSLVVLPGGEKEQLLTECGKERIWIQKRKGFVKLAVKFGAPIIPCYAFGENDLFLTRKWLYSVREWVANKFYCCIMFFGGKFGFFPGPNKKIQIAIGEMIEVNQQENPTEEYVNEIHQLYIHRLRDVFEKHKVFMGEEYANRKIEVY